MRFETSPSQGQRWACPAERNWLRERAADNFRPDGREALSMTTTAPFKDNFRPAVDPQPQPFVAPSDEAPAGSNSAEAVLFPDLVRLEE